MHPPALLQYCEQQQAWLIDTIEALVRAESPSHDKAAVDACVSELARIAAGAGLRVTRLPVAEAGDHLRIEIGEGDSQLLLLGHTDTVWPVGTLAVMPIRREGDRLYGPGVYDMKAGLALGLLALRAVAASLDRPPHVVLLATSDEEVGSATSRALIEEEARRSKAVLVLEPALEGGGVKTGRKGVGEFRIDLEGVPAHAGLRPEAGASAIRELARQVLAIEALADPSMGTTINVGVVGGGTRSNVVAEHAWALVDVRVTSAAEAARITAALRALSAVDGRVRVRVSGEIARPPLERSPLVLALYEQARAAAAALGRPLPEGVVGGASDGNFTAALGVPTLDGLGPVGDGAHARHEHVLLEPMAFRAALLALLTGRLASAAPA
ncbi:MAG TPA: M20 family metallopeptidase [Vicinamibacterales bacterium]